MIKLLSNQISPNLNISDFFKGLFHLFSQKDLNFEQLFCSSDYILYNAGRTGLSRLINTINLPRDKKIGIPAFTCAVTATPFLQAGYQIEWIDVDQNGLIDFDDFEKKSDKIALVLAIHTFGQEVDIQKFAKFCNKKSIFLLEDCAHLLPTNHYTPNTSQSDARLYSFGREKVLSCVSGGAIVWNKNSECFKESPQNLLAVSSQPSALSTLRLICHPLIYCLSLPWWHAGGKVIPLFFRKIGFIPLAVTKAEKSGREDFPQKQLAPALQHILLKQWLEYSNKMMEQKIKAEIWKTELKKYLPKAKFNIPPNAFRLIVSQIEAPQKKVIQTQRNFHLNEWNGAPIAPLGTDLEKFEYREGQCRNAEYFSRHYQTFPTHKKIKKEDIYIFKKMIEKNLIFMENIEDV